MDLKYIFNPKSVAVIGASKNRKKAGNIILRNLIKGFKGKIFAVNPKYDEVEGIKCYHSILEIPEEVDLVIIAVPSKIVPEIIEQCGKKGVRGAIIISAGFSEIGEEGKRLEEKIKEYSKKYSIRVVGPNGMGVFDPYSGVDSFFVSQERLPRPKKGKIAILSQSGAIALALMEWLSYHGIGVSKIVSYGNKIDVDEIEMFRYLKEDKNTEAVFLYIEGLKPKKGREFITLAKEISKKKRIVVLKSGKTEKGSKAASSHTASMAGNYKVYENAFKQGGIIEAKNFDEFLTYLKGLSFFNPIKGKKLVIYTNGGGAGVLTTDEASKAGFKLPSPSESLKEELSKILPPFASIKNPIDTTAQVGEDKYLEGLKVLLESKEYDFIISILLPQLENYTEDFPKKFKEVYSYQKPLAFIVFGGELSEKIRKEISKIVPVFENPRNAVLSLKILMDNLI